MGAEKKKRCIRGHDTVKPSQRYSNGRCKICAKADATKWMRDHPKRLRISSDWVERERLERMDPSKGPEGMS